LEKRKVAAGIIALFLGRSTEYPSDFRRYNYHRGCAAVFLCGEEAMKNKIEVVI